MIDMSKVYPIILTKTKQGFVVYVPDFNINTQGKDYAEAILMARDAIGLMGIDMQDNGEELPIPSEIDSISKNNKNDIVTLVDVDFTEYRRKNDMKTVRRNVSLPAWLDLEAEKAGINVSALLQKALKKELKLDNL